MLRFSASGVNNEDIFSEYILKVLGPWKIAKNVNPILIFDEAACHLTEKVEKALKQVQILPIVIPGGSTSLLQPLDVELNKPMKGTIRTKYTDWLEQKSKNIQGNMEPPELLTLIEWSISAMNCLSKEQISKSFITTGIVKELIELRQKNLLHSKLSQLIDEYIEKIGEDRDLLDDVEDLYADNTQNEMKRIGNQQELEVSDAV